MSERGHIFRLGISPDFVSMPIGALFSAQTYSSNQHRCRAQEMRTIARGIWDSQERANLLEFIDEYERLARAAKAVDHGVVLPVRAMLNSR
jgi:hypothetical protein